jgi:protein arginine phosphatase
MNIYFVCTGNTCRSPMAEAILKSLQIENVRVKSAGVYALEGGAMSENAQSALADDNITLDHVSRAVNEHDLSWADFVLTMTAKHKELVLLSYPQFEGKVFTLKEFTAPYASKDISDPFGGDTYQYKQTFNELKHYILLLQSKLEKQTEGITSGTKENEV